MGEKRRNELLRAFGTVRAVKAADYEQAVRGNTEETPPRAVYDRFHPAAGEE